MEMMMSITTDRKQELIKTHQQDAKDTGSPQVQISILTERINNLSEHMKNHKKDFSTRRGLLRMVSQRRKQLDYLKRKNEGAYQKIIKALGIRK